MRVRGFAVLVLALPACASPTGGSCEVPRECPSDLVCARDGLCTDPEDVRAVKATWTIQGAPADRAACKEIDLAIRFSSGEPSGRDDLDYAPVPCFVGQFFVDRLPLRYTIVELGVHEGGGPTAIAPIDPAGMATLDLPL